MRVKNFHLHINSHYHIRFHVSNPNSVRKIVMTMSFWKMYHVSASEKKKKKIPLSYRVLRLNSNLGCCILSSLYHIYHNDNMIVESFSRISFIKIRKILKEFPGSRYELKVIYLSHFQAREK